MKRLTTHSSTPGPAPPAGPPSSPTCQHAWGTGDLGLGARKKPWGPAGPLVDRRPQALQEGALAPGVSMGLWEAPTTPRRRVSMGLLRALHQASGLMDAGLLGRRRSKQSCCSSSPAAVWTLSSAAARRASRYPRERAGKTGRGSLGTSTAAIWRKGHTGLEPGQLGEAQLPEYRRPAARYTSNSERPNGQCKGLCKFFAPGVHLQTEPAQEGRRVAPEQQCRKRKARTDARGAGSGAPE